MLTKRKPKTKHQCHDCESSIPKHEYGDCYNPDDKQICYSCDENYFDCWHCGGSTSKSDGKESLSDDSRLYCEDCFDELFTPCDCCDERYAYNDMVALRDSDQRVCRACYDMDDAYQGCHRCDSPCLTSNMEEHLDEHFCLNCFEQAIENVIQSYGHRPTMRFKKSKKQEGSNAVFIRASSVEDTKGKLLATPKQKGVKKLAYTGIEIEVENTDGSRAKNAQKVQHILGSIAYLKHDSSLSNGFEIVTHPFTLDWAMEEYDWKDKLAQIRKLGIECKRSCGLHVHMSKNAVDKESWWKVAWFMARCQERLIPFTRRKGGSLERWGKFEGVTHLAARAAVVMSHESIGYPALSGRYNAMNFTDQTVEFRCFKATLDYNTFMSTIKFVNSALDFALANTYKFFERKSKTDMWNTYLDFIKSHKEYVSLHAYLGRKKLTKYTV